MVQVSEVEQAETYEIIKPVYENTRSGAETISRWLVMGVVTAPTEIDAFDFGRKHYGQDIDVRKAGPRFDG